MFAIFDAFLIRLPWDKFGLSEKKVRLLGKIFDLPQFCTQFCFDFFYI